MLLLLKLEKISGNFQFAELSLIFAELRWKIAEINRFFAE
ncbi:hypothetical protein SAMD00020551_0872 [Mesobacillus selenatarsenatis SF-1]|uniref:Uncharacterized protein n=1 Tax=Mesobacillus selenatarsenatis (strain DSM 18680 / JCM 14380 / FERM P-15431 / SF-1) TaxID=1321606 RepID=A0A0A8X122_MESS1|nr:hypothetical protein SAMD00020551_0872 [Mesobacillus selenatarsenatis SF-1]